MMMQSASRHVLFKSVARRPGWRRAMSTNNAVDPTSPIPDWIVSAVKEGAHYDLSFGLSPIITESIQWLSATADIPQVQAMVAITAGLRLAMAPVTYIGHQYELQQEAMVPEQRLLRQSSTSNDEYKTKLKALKQKYGTDSIWKSNIVLLNVPLVSALIAGTAAMGSVSVDSFLLPAATTTILLLASEASSFNKKELTAAKTKTAASVKPATDATSSVSIDWTKYLFRGSIVFVGFPLFTLLNDAQLFVLMTLGSCGIVEDVVMSRFIKLPNIDTSSTTTTTTTTTTTPSTPPVTFSNPKSKGK